MQTSQSFFDAEKQLFSIVRVLDAACAADSKACTTFLNNAAQNLTSESNCKAEYDAQQYLVLQAYKGLTSYETLYTASCLQDPKQDMYCFADAVTNSSTVSDAYLYFLPYGEALPGASTPSCDWCTQQTMAAYRAASADRDQLVSAVYSAAAVQINTLCGVNYVNSTLPPAVASRGGMLRPPPSSVMALAGFVAAVVLSLWL